MHIMSRHPPQTICICHLMVISLMVQCIQTWMSVLPTTEDVLRHVQTLLDHFSVVVKVDTL